MKREIVLDKDTYIRLLRILNIASNVFKFKAGSYQLAKESLSMATDLILNSKDLDT